MATQGTGHAALLVVDMQRWSLGIGQEILPEVNNTISTLRAAGIPILFTQQGLKDPKAEAKSNVFVQKVGVGACQQVGRLGWELMPGLDHCEDDLFITSKTTYDAFYNTELLYVLLELKVDTVIICGVMTNTSCETTARSAFTQNFGVVFCSNGSAASDSRMHDATLKSMLYGFAEVVKCNVVRSRFQTKWLTTRLMQRRIELASELPPRHTPQRSEIDRASRLADTQIRREDSRASTAVDQEDEGWWLKTHRAKATTAEGFGGTAGGAGGGSLFSKMATQRRQPSRGSERTATSSPFANSAWIPPTRRARLEAQMESQRAAVGGRGAGGEDDRGSSPAPASPPGRFVGLPTAEALEDIWTPGADEASTRVGSDDTGQALATEGAGCHGERPTDAPARGEGPVQYFFFPAVKPKPSPPPGSVSSNTSARRGAGSDESSTLSGPKLDSHAAAVDGELLVAGGAGCAESGGGESAMLPPPAAPKQRSRTGRTLPVATVLPRQDQHLPSWSNEPTLHHDYVAPAPPAGCFPMSPSAPSVPPIALPPEAPALRQTASVGSVQPGDNVQDPPTAADHGEVPDSAVRLVQHRAPVPPGPDPPAAASARADPRRWAASSARLPHADGRAMMSGEQMPTPPAHPPPVPPPALAHLHKPQRSMSRQLRRLQKPTTTRNSSARGWRSRGAAAKEYQAAQGCQGHAAGECPPPGQPPPPLRRLPDQGQIPSMPATMRTFRPVSGDAAKKRPGRRPAAVSSPILTTPNSSR